MDFTKVIKEYGGKKLDLEEVDVWEKWSLEYFKKDETIASPNLSLNFDLDIDDISKRFTANGHKSFTSLLAWSFCQVVKKFPCLNYRFLSGDWYKFKSLPVMMPVAVGGTRRFSRIFMENTDEDCFFSFNKEYLKQLESIKNKTMTDLTISNELYFTSNIIGNLPNIKFTSLVTNPYTVNTGRQIFYFGQRFSEKEKLHIPLHVTLDHSNADPYVLSLVLEKLKELWNEVNLSVQKKESLLST